MIMAQLLYCSSDKSSFAINNDREWEYLPKAGGGIKEQTEMMRRSVWLCNNRLENNDKKQGIQNRVEN